MNEEYTIDKTATYEKSSDLLVCNIGLDLSIFDRISLMHIVDVVVELFNKDMIEGKYGTGHSIPEPIFESAARFLHQEYELPYDKEIIMKFYYEVFWEADEGIVSKLQISHQNRHLLPARR